MVREVFLQSRALERLAERASFRGYKHRARDAYIKLSEIQPEVAGWRNLLGVQYLMSGQNSQVTLCDSILHAPCNVIVCSEFRRE